MKPLKHRIIPRWDGLEISYEIKGTDKPIVFCIKNPEEELYYAPMENEDGVYKIEIDEDMIDSIGSGEYTYSVRIQDTPKRTVGQGKLTIE